MTPVEVGDRDRPGAPHGAGPYLSVIVTAYRRKQYLLDAVRSVLDQDLDRSEYEVIVLKDFSDTSIDPTLSREAPVVRVHTEDLRLMGEMLAKGIELARGEVLCFLEDDDRFCPGKLRGVRDLFRSDPRLAFVRNSYQAIDAAGAPLLTWERMRPQPSQSFVLEARGPSGPALRRVFRFGTHVNLSTMSIRIELARARPELLRAVPASPDLYLFLAAAVSDGTIRAEAARWNEYRVHTSTSHAALAEGNEGKDVADTLRSQVTARLMEARLADAPNRPLARRFLACFRYEVEATLYLLDPGARWSLRGWLKFLRTVAERRQRYLGAIALFALYRAVRPSPAVRRYRKWRFRSLRQAAGEP